MKMTPTLTAAATLMAVVAAANPATAGGSSSKASDAPVNAEAGDKVQLGLYVRLVAKTGKEAELEAFLRGALPLAEAEEGTPVWYAVKFGEGDFAIFDAFAGKAGREAHLNGKIAAALMANAERLLANAPNIETWDTLAVK